ncbi:MAG TPA: DctP family TRAP transporter solute-binding subunit [Desulfohalobiaceae bacterium]|nr:DctP family TRAP transporter solute-binding subunit [Desulfohalobiaceae bacterium]
MVLIIGLAVSTVFFQGPAFAKDEDVVVLKLGHVAVPDNPYALGAAKFAELVNEKTDGKVVIKLFPNSQLGNQEKLIEGIALGTIDFALTTTAVLGQFESKLLVFGFPYMMRNREHAYKALDTIGMELGKNLEPKGIKIMGFYENGVRHMVNDVKKLEKPEDMEGLKMRVMTTPVYIELMKALGADPTPMAFGEVYTACQQGTIDGLECPAVHIYQKKFYEVNKYVTKTSHTYESEVLTMSMRTWKKLPEDIQEILVESNREALEYARALAVEQEAGFFKKISESGICSVDEVDIEPFKEKSKAVWVTLQDTVGADLIDRIQAIE